MFVDFRDDRPIFDAIRVIGGKFDQRDVFAIHGAIAEARRLRDDKPLFDVARRLDDDDDGLSQLEVDTLNAGLIAARAGIALPMVDGGARAIGPAGLALIKAFEGLRLTAYLCPARVWTIGYGSTGPHVRPGLTIAEPEAEDLLERDLDRFEDAVDKAAPDATTWQFDAMVSLAFNIGIGAFGKSSVLRLHKAGEFRRAAEAFGMWVKADGRTLPGLVRRRAAEAELYRRAAA